MSDAIKRLRELEAAATIGPWGAVYENGIQTTNAVLSVNKDGSMSKRHTGHLPIFFDATGRRKRLTEDIAFITAARNALPLLLDVAEAAYPLVRLVRNISETWGIEADVETLLDALARLEEEVGRE